MTTERLARRWRLVVSIVAVLGLLICWACATSSSAEEEASIIETRWVQVDDALRIRAKAGYDGEKIGRLYPGDEVQAIEDIAGWTLVLCDVEAGKGWVKSEYLTNRAADTGAYRNDSGGRIHIRDGVGGSPIDWLEDGKQISVTAWACDADGILWGFMDIGWVRYDCLSKVDEE